jgi:hypothetical protein
MTTTGERPTSNIKAMLTGFEEVEEEDTEINALKEVPDEA